MSQTPIDYDELIEVARYDNALNARIVLGRLQAEGVPAHLAHENHINADWCLAQALGGVQLRVARRFQAHAQSVLTALQDDEYALAQTAPDDNVDAVIACPKCQNTTDIGKKNNPLWVMLDVLLLGLSGIIFPPPKSQRTCPRCQHRWQEKDA